MSPTHQIPHTDRAGPTARPRTRPGPYDPPFSQTADALAHATAGLQHFEGFTDLVFEQWLPPAERALLAAWLALASGESVTLVRVIAGPGAPYEVSLRADRSVDMVGWEWVGGAAPAVA